MSITILPVEHDEHVPGRIGLAPGDSLLAHTCSSYAWSYRTSTLRTHVAITHTRTRNPLMIDCALSAIQWRLRSDTRSVRLLFRRTAAKGRIHAAKVHNFNYANTQAPTATTTHSVQAQTHIIDPNPDKPGDTASVPAILQTYH